ncbi:MAG: ATP-binding protein [Henriciella sp.]
MDRLPVVVCEVAPIRDENGTIVDLEWIDSNTLMDQTILPDGESVIGMRIFEFDPTYRDSDMVKSVLKVLETGEPDTFVTEQGRAAKKFSKVMKTSVIPTEQGVLCCSHEITDIAAERDEARGRADLLKLACDRALHGIAISNDQGQLLYVNEALAKLAGYEREELIGANNSILMDEQSYQSGSSFIRDKLIDGDVSHRNDSELLTRTGERIRVSAELTISRLPGSSSPILITHVQDVREERRKAHELREALQQANQATRMKSEFLANMSHEIRTPLNGVLGMAQTLAHGDLTPSQADQVSIILDSGKTLMVLLNDILDLSKIEAGKLEVTPVASDLRHKLSGLFKLHESVAKEKGIDLKLFIHPDVPSSLVIDPVRVRQCVGNLVSNAIKFTESGEVLIAVTCETQEDGKACVTIHVSDTGCGIAADKLERVFEAFAQEDGSKTRKFGGTGLGLAITRKLARMMGGDVSAVSEQGRGSVFTLTFEAEKVAAPTLVPSQSSSTPQPQTHTSLTGLRALIVDDNAINIRVARSFLEQHGIGSLDAKDGNYALDILSREKVDLVLMDIHMPGLDGMEAFRRLRMSNSPNRLTPVIALTADSMLGDRERFLGMGFDGYVSKPIEERMLMTAIGQVLNQTPMRAVG